MRERKIYHWKKKIIRDIEENARSKFRDPKVKKTVSKKEIPGNPEQKKYEKRKYENPERKRKYEKKIWGKSLTKKNSPKKQIGEKFWTKK